MMATLQTWWYRIGCIFVGHAFTNWIDSYDGNAARTCTRCLRIELAPYMQVWKQVRDGNKAGG